MVDPAVFAVRAPQPILPLEAAPQAERLAPRALDHGAIVGMHRFEPARAALLLHVAPGVVLPRLVHEAAAAVAVGEPDERGKCVEQIRAPRGILEDSGDVS